MGFHSGLACSFKSPFERQRLVKMQKPLEDQSSSSFCKSTGSGRDFDEKRYGWRGFEEWRMIFMCMTSMCRLEFDGLMSHTDLAARATLKTWVVDKKGLQAARLREIEGATALDAERWSKREWNAHVFNCAWKGNGTGSICKIRSCIIPHFPLLFLTYSSRFKIHITPQFHYPSPSPVWSEISARAIVLDKPAWIQPTNQLTSRNKETSRYGGVVNARACYHEFSLEYIQFSSFPRELGFESLWRLPDNIYSMNEN